MIAITCCCNAQVIKGKVIDSASGKPIAGANIYLNGTYKGTTSNNEGMFTINSAEVNTPLMVSYIGYEAQSVFNYAGKDLIIALKPKSIILREVTIGADAMGREAEMKIFLTEFIGSASKDCVISNPDDIYFTYHKSSQLLTAGADKPLIIYNKKLGYKITYFLGSFTNQVNATTYDGDFFFTEDTAGLQPKQLKKILKARDEAYFGSQMHFIRALWADKLKQEGFELDDHKSYQDIITTRLGQKFIALTVIIGQGQKSLTFAGPLNITYKGRSSFLKQQETNEETLIAPNGFYDNDLVWGGEMGGQRISQMLPFEFLPSK